MHNPNLLGGNPLDMKPLNELKEKHRLFVVEDAACSLGAEYDGKKTGTSADITCFSFHPRKIVTTGEGGMAVTDNPSYAERITSLKNFGMKTKKGKSEFVRLGTNSKLSDILSAIGLAQMKKIDRIIKRRIQLANYYTKVLGDNDLIRPPEKSESALHTFQTYAIYIEKEHARDRIMEDLRKLGIETQIGTYALHLQPTYERAKTISKLERAEKLYRNLLALPMSHSMSREDQEFVGLQIEKSFQAI